MDETERRRALILANRLPYPLDDGWKVRTFHMVRSIAAVADTTLVVFHSDDDESLLSAREALGPSVSVLRVRPPKAYTSFNLLRGLFSRTPVHVWNQESVEMRDCIRNLTANGSYDWCITETVLMCRYLDALPRITLRIIDTHNIDSITMSRYALTMHSFARRWYASITAKRFASFERRVFADADLVWVCSGVEREALARHQPTGNVHVVPNGVDTLLMAPSGVPSVSGRIMFFGRLDYHPNVDAVCYFVRDILPLIRQQRGDVELHVVGAGASRAIASLASPMRGIVLRGRVEDLQAVVQEAEVIVVPLRAGGGTRLKILEAASLARPVVSTTVGAEGLDLAPGREIILADAPSEFAAAVLRLLSDSAERSDVGESGRRAVMARYDWASIGATARDTLSRSRAS